MAEWRGMKVKLNNPTRIQKGEPGYGRKKLKCLYQIMGKLRRLCLVIQIWKSEKITQRLELHFVPDTNVPQLKTKQQQDTGLVGCGKCLLKK